MSTLVSPNGQWRNPENEEIVTLLKTIKRIAVAGLSSNPERPSYGIAQFLISKGYEVIPVNPKETEVLGQKAYPDLRSVPGKIDLVDCFRRSEVVGETIDEGLLLGIKNFWLQEGVRDEKRGFMVRQKGGFMIMDRCIFKEYQRLLGEET